MDHKRYLELIAPAMDIVVKKHEDYNTGIDLHEYFPFGDASYIQMMHVKLLRMRSVLEAGGEPNYESIKDSVHDLINYAIFYLDFLKLNEDK